MSSRLFTACVLASTLAFSACNNDDDVEPVNEEEVITTALITFTAPGASPVVMSFRDLDGDGGAAGVTTGGTLAADTDYSYTVSLLNEQASPAENVTSEVQAEGTDHQFFFSTTNTLNLSLAYGDMDADGRAIGIAGTARTRAASMGALTLTLRHEPNKTAAGVATGDISNAGGETDVEVVFPVTIE